MEGPCIGLTKPSAAAALEAEDERLRLRDANNAIARTTRVTKTTVPQVAATMTTGNSLPVDGVEGGIADGRRKGLPAEAAT